MQFLSYGSLSPTPITATQAELEAEAILKGKAEAQDLKGKAEADIIKAKSEVEKEEVSLKDTAVEETAFIVKAKAEEEAVMGLKGADATSDSEVEDLYDNCPYDSDDDPDTVCAKLAAWYEEQVRKRHARLPWLKYDSAADILKMHGEASALYNGQQPVADDGVAPVVPV